MIRLSGLINLQALKEQDLPTKQPEQTPSGDTTSDNDLLKQKLTKLQSMELSPDQQKKVEEMLAKLQELTGNQKKLDVDGDGEIEGSDLQKLRAGDATDEEIVLERGDDDDDARRDAWAEKSDEPYRSPYDRDAGKKTGTWKTYSGKTATRNSDGTVTYTDEAVNAAKGDDEANMAKSDLIAMQHKLEKLIQSMGDNDELEAWVQSKITLASDYIGAVYDRMHGTKGDPDPTTDTVNEAAATGWEKTVLAMKKHKEIDNPWALSHWMKKKGYHPQNESVVAKESIEETGVLKKAAYMVKATKDIIKNRGREKDAEKQANVEPRIGKSGKETPASARDRKAASGQADKFRKRINKRVKGIDTARGFKGNDVKVKNPETGKEILAKSAASDPSHPAHSAAKSALKKK